MSMAARTIQSFLDALASGEPTPGGGGAAALTGAQAAALVSMVLNFTVGKKKYAAVDEEMRSYLVETEQLRAELTALIDEDERAFAGVAATYTMPKESDDEKAARTAAMQSALKVAAAVPFVIAEKCMRVMQLAVPVGAKGNANVVSDAATANYLALSAFKSALVNVNVNLTFIKDETFVAEWAGKRDLLQGAAMEAYDHARAACEATIKVTL